MSNFLGRLARAFLSNFWNFTPSPVHTPVVREYYGEMGEEFKRIVHTELNGRVFDDVADQMHNFGTIYQYDVQNFLSVWDLGDSTPLALLCGRTLCTGFDRRRVARETILSAMLAAFGSVIPAHTGVERVLRVDAIEMFQCIDAEGRAVLFAFDLREVWHRVDSMSVIGPIYIGQRPLTDQLHGLREMGLIQLFNTLTHAHKLRMSDLDRRAELVAVVAMSLVDESDQGIGSLGGDNLSLIARMVMRDD